MLTDDLLNGTPDLPCSIYMHLTNMAACHVKCGKVKQS